MTFSKSRGRVSTFFISLYNPVLGFLWIGRGWLAVVTFLLHITAVTGICVYYRELATVGSMGLITIDFLLKAALAVGSCTLIRPATTKWYANGFAVMLIFVGYVAFATISIRTFIVQPFSVPAMSMAPTLVIGDHFFASKAAYGYSRQSVPYGLFPIQGRIFAKQPQRGDVAVFKSNDGEIYVKRVIGLPGETIQMINGILHIDGKPVPIQEMGNYALFDSSSSRNTTSYKETLPNGVSYTVLSMVDDAPGDNTGIYTVPDGQYFMMGDNRDNSADSRFTMGAVPFENLIGKAVWIFWNSEGIDYSDRQSTIPKQGS